MLNALYLMVFLLSCSALCFLLGWVFEKLKIKGKYDNTLLWITVIVMIVAFVAIFGLEGYGPLPWEDRVLRR